MKSLQWTLANVYVTREEYEVQFVDIFDQIIAYAAGTPINVVNFI
jgi:D-3-phosphoglycerate dehydrogenase